MSGPNLVALCLVICLLDRDGFQTLASSTRERRAILKDELYRWDKGIVPYLITDSVDAEGRVQIQRAMATYERFTCIRFVPYTNTTVEDYRLSHQGHLRFVKKSSCTAVLGNNRNPDGQEISCCTGTQCIHELGHSLGMIHEHQSPDRDGWVRINPQNIQTGSVKWFDQYDHSAVLTNGYDMTSAMSYTEYGLAQPGAGPSMTFLFPELMATDDYYYMFKEVVDAHDCKGLWCPDSDLVCSNDGYLSVVDGQCVCRCHSGLDPTTGCSTILKQVPKGTTFPGGQYALPMTTSGCPDSEFAEGFRRHYGDTDGNNVKTESYNLAGNVTGRLAEHYFCVTTGQVGTEDVRWTPGEYCIYRKGGVCPDGFEAGLIQFIDRPSSSLPNAVSGELPDGRFDKETHFEFCCRQDGFPRDYLVLPNTSPMALFQVSENCQKILGMHDIEERFGFNNVNYERAGETGMTPFSYLQLDTLTFTHFTRHCYYRPADMDCGGIIHLDQDNPEVTFSSKMGSELECTWILHAPDDARILLNFPEFNITSSTGKITGSHGDDCIDYLEISYARIGQTGLKFCGNRLAHSIVSIYSSIKLRLLTFESSESRFTATASLVPDNKLCYSTTDSGASYVGDVYYTRDFKPCLNWTDVQHCPHSAFNNKDAGRSLTGNYCRNPGNGLMPWCYTESKDCVRNYCDVCGIESWYDVLEDCQDRKTRGYCLTDPEALSQCALTCKDQLAPPRAPLTDVSSVTCGNPPVVEDGKMTTTSKPTYSVGDTVAYRCIHSNSVTEIRCLTTGQWSSVPYVCHDCSEGWTYYQGQCYIYHGTKLNFTSAKEVCAKHNATVAAAKTKDRNDFLDSLRMVDHRIWLGAQDLAMNGTWLWQDGDSLSWTNWKQDHPNALWLLERCLIMTENKKWIDFYCEYRMQTFICERSTDYVPVCADYQDNCQELLTYKPSMCSDSEDFARRACRLTCAFCNKTLVCGQEAPTSNVVLDDPNVESVPVGGRIVYTCKSGYRYVSGDAIRYCGDDGVLSGSPLVCEDWNRVVARTASVNLKEARGSYGRFYRAYTANNRNFRIYRAGRLVSWAYFSNRPADITLQVWRTAGKGGLFTLVGQNKVPTEGGRSFIRYQVPQSQQIRVRRGDIIGIHYGGKRGGVPYKSCSKKGLHILELRRRVKNADTFKVGRKYRFRKRLRCAIFSFRALLGRP